jgi:lipopolysaccharide/colanic/teichoic acid biosynthesis glycosyltransferase
MREFRLSVLDTALILFATLIALGLRKDFELTASGLEDVLPYFAATAIASIIVVAVSRLNKTMWRYPGPQSYLHVAGVVILVCFGAVSLCFAYNRLEGIPRSLPFLQCIVSIIALEAVRVLYKLHRTLRARKLSPSLRGLFAPTDEVTVLVVGESPLTETYLTALAESGRTHINVAGLLAEAPNHVGRLFTGYPILGVAEDVENIIDGLDVHGVSVDGIVLVTPFNDLSESAREALIRAERLRGITLQLLGDSLDLNIERMQVSHEALEIKFALPSELKLQLYPAEVQAYARRNFWKMKRALDVFAALVLILLLSPVMLLVSIFVAASVGFPVKFWQRRPGLAGKPFHLYKFRTMRAEHAPDGRRLSDAERVSPVGKFLRRTRLDELPQLVNILRGDMSFIGPRPLLAKELPRECSARFLVRPGLTGWAQVVGGRDISAADKLALDIWYVRNAAILLDLEIVARTIPVVLFGEKISEHLIERAWRDSELRRF